MPKKLEIHQMRLSFIWAETNLGLLGDPKAPAVPLGFLGSRDSYAETFDKVLKKEPVPAQLKAPWDKAGQHFWQYYLENKQKLEEMPGDKAWKFLVPFRGRIAVKQVTAPSLTGESVNFQLESFIYPYGFGLVITVTIKASQNLTDAAKVLSEVRKDGRLEVEWESGGKEQLYLNQLAHKCLDLVRQQALGPTAGAGSIPVEPFTVFTILKGTGTDLDAPLVQDEEIHALLEGVTTWPAIWKKSNLPGLDAQVILPLKASASDGAIVYARDRGRAVWFPALFTDVSKVRSSLSCYHRNVVFASLQTESLCRFLMETAHQITSASWLSLRVMHRDCAKLAAGIVGRMYGGNKETFRSMSPRYQIQQNDYEKEINTIRSICSMLPLA